MSATPLSVSIIEPISFFVRWLCHWQRYCIALCLEQFNLLRRQPLRVPAHEQHEGNHNNAADDYWANKIAPLHHLVQGAAPVEQHDAGVIAQLFNCGLVVR